MRGLTQEDLDLSIYASVCACKSSKVTGYVTRLHMRGASCFTRGRVWPTASPGSSSHK